MSLRDSLPRSWFTEPGDPEGLMGALVDEIDGELTGFRDQVRAIADLFSPRTAPVPWLPFLAHRLGWNLARDTPEALARKLVSLLGPAWRAKGTLLAVEGMVRIFLGLDVRALGRRTEGWQLGRSCLGGRRWTHTAAGGETDLDLGDLSFLPGARDVRVWRNGVELGRHQFLDDDRRILLVTEGLTYRAAGGETTLTIPFTYAPHTGTLQLLHDGVRLPETAWTEDSSTTITLGALTRGAELIVRRRSDPTPLATGDLVVVQALRDRATALAPDLDADVTRGLDPAGTLAERLRGLTIVLRFPRLLDGPEIALAVWAANLVKPSRSRIAIPQNSDYVVRPAWRLGAGQLGRGTLLDRG